MERKIMRCPNCNHESSATQKFCANYGTRLPQASNVNQGGGNSDYVEWSIAGRT